MSKAFVDELIRNMRMGGIVEKAAPWMVEGFGERQMNVRYVGINLKDDWLEVFSRSDNVLVKFIIDRSSASVEFYIANKPPFFRFASRRFSDGDKWESLLGEVKRRLKKDKTDYLNHTDKVGNLYIYIKPFLK